jgi:hypothetical protein
VAGGCRIERILPNAIVGGGLSIGFDPALAILMSAEIIRQILSDPQGAASLVNS